MGPQMGPSHSHVDFTKHEEVGWSLFMLKYMTEGNTFTKLDEYIFFSLQKAVPDVCWSPKSSTVFACVNEGAVEIWDLSQNTWVCLYNREIRRYSFFHLTSYNGSSWGDAVQFCRSLWGIQGFWNTFQSMFYRNYKLTFVWSCMFNAIACVCLYNGNAQFPCIFPFCRLDPIIVNNPMAGVKLSSISFSKNSDVSKFQT